jgi:hypothetical protein
VRYPADGIGTGDQPVHGHPAPDGQPGCPFRHRRHGALGHGAAAGEHLEPVVALLRGTGEEFGRVAERVEPQRAVALDRRHDVGQFLFENLAVAGQKEMGQAELGHPLALPTLPGLGLAGRRGLRVAFERGHRMPVAGQEHAQPHTYDTAADYQDIRHTCPPQCARIVSVRSIERPVRPGG